jgi:hypothetical protein
LRISLLSALEILSSAHSCDPVWPCVPAIRDRRSFQEAGAPRNGALLCGNKIASSLVSKSLWNVDTLITDATGQVTASQIGAPNAAAASLVDHERATFEVTDARSWTYPQMGQIIADIEAPILSKFRLSDFHPGT